MANRLNVPGKAIGRENYTFWCPTCGLQLARDGNYGMLNFSGACSSGCYRKWKALDGRRSALEAGTITSLTSSGPTLPGPIGS